MIELLEENGDVTVLLNGQALDVLDGDGLIVAQCELGDLDSETSSDFPAGLVLQIHDSEGFDTFLFHEVAIQRGTDEVISIDFVCLQPNKYWEHRWGLASYLGKIAELAEMRGLSVVDQELEDDWKRLTIRMTSPAEYLRTALQSCAAQLKTLLSDTETALAGFHWKEAYEKDEGLFCAEVISPLLRRMGFIDIQFTGGPREYGRDYTFSEMTPFGFLRHYGMQVKDGNMSGGNNSQVDEIIGQLSDAFAMPYLVVSSKETRFISTFVVAISGRFTSNAKEKIFNKINAGLIGSVYFLDQDKIRELAERYWK